MKAEVTLSAQSKFKIEDKPIIRPRAQREQYPFDKMKVGQSFYIERGHVDVSAVRQAAAQYGRRHDCKFSIIRDGLGYRCGRIK